MKKIISIHILLLLTITVFSKPKLKNAKNLYSIGNYYESLSMYEEIYKEQELPPENLLQFANSYYHLNDFVNAEKLYFLLDTIANKDMLFTAKDYFNYGVTLQNLGRYTEAIKKLNRAEEFGYPNVGLVNAYQSSCIWAMKNIDKEGKWRTKMSVLNADGQSFGVQYYKDGIVYSAELLDSTTEKEKKKKKKDKKIPQFDVMGNKFLDLFYIELNELEPVLKTKELFSNNLKFPYHIGSVSFTGDFSRIYYTKTVTVPKTNATVLKIYEATYSEDKQDWVDETELPFNSNTHSSAHPSITFDGKVLYFSSDREGGYGGKDLYVAYKKDSEWSEPVNLGGSINTVGDELFPFISKDNTLYFSSDGKLGFGGLDVFSSVSTDHKKWSEAKNMMQPINSSKDDFAFTLSYQRRDQGFFSSSRNGNGNSDFIYTFQRQLNQWISLIGKTINAYTNNAVPLARVVVESPQTGEVLYQTTSDLKGYFEIALRKEKIEDLDSLHIVFSKEGYKSLTEKTITYEFIQEANNEEEYNVKLEPFISGLDESFLSGTKHDGSHTFTISDDKLYFGFNNAQIRTNEAKSLLNNFAQLLKNNPNLQVEITAHTDSRGSQDYNFDLSNRRAENTKKYLVQQGINEKRIKARGYGEKYLLNRCKDNVPCSEKEHKENRRIEVKIKKY